MKEEKEGQKPYEPPRILASYSREELVETIRPHGSTDQYQQPGCGACTCGCGCS